MQMDVCAKRVPQRLEVICVCVWVSAARRWAARGPLVAPLADWNEKHWQPGASLRLGLQAAVVKCERVTVWCVRKCEREKKWRGTYKVEGRRKERHTKRKQKHPRWDRKMALFSWCGFYVRWLHMGECSGFKIPVFSWVMSLRLHLDERITNQSTPICSRTRYRAQRWDEKCSPGKCTCSF